MHIQYSKEASKYISKLDKPTKKRIKEAVLGLTETPPKGDIKLLKGRNSEYRLRVGKYRILYEYSDANKITILIVNKIDSRGDIYK